MKCPILFFAVLVLVSSAESWWWKCPTECQLVWKPICLRWRVTGNPQTFINRCTLDNYLCRTGRRDIDYVRTACPRVPDTEYLCTRTCSMEWTPICLIWRKDGVVQTFTNQCAIDYFLCRTGQTPDDYVVTNCYGAAV